MGRCRRMSIAAKGALVFARHERPDQFPEAWRKRRGPAHHFLGETDQMISSASFAAIDMQDIRYDFAGITQPLEGDLIHSFRRAGLNFFQEHKLGFGFVSDQYTIGLA